MAYTLDTFLKTSGLPGLKVHTSELDYSAIPVDSASIQEYPLDDLLYPNDLVLSEAIHCHDDPDLFCSFVEDVYRAGAAALILSFRDENYRIPQAVIDRANALKFPILTIDWDLQYIQILRSILQGIAANESAEYMAIQNRLMDAYFRGEPIDHAAHLISDAFGAPVVLYDSFLKMQAQWPRTGDPADTLPDAEIAAYPIQFSGRVWGSLHIMRTERSEKLLQRPDLINSNISMPLYLWFNRDRIAEMTRMKVNNELIHSLIDRTYDNPDQVILQGQELGINLLMPFVCICVRMGARDGEDSAEYSAETVEVMTSIEGLAERLAGNDGFRLILAQARSRCSLFLSREMLTTGAAADFAKKFQAVITEAFPSKAFYIGISRCSSGALNEFPIIYQEALLAMNHAASTGNVNRIATFKDTTLNRMLALITADADVSRQAREFMQPLVYASSSGHGTDYPGTLTEYLNQNYNVSQTARVLHLSRQSMLYRLEKIQDLLQVDLQNHDDLFLLELYTRVLQGH